MNLTPWTLLRLLLFKEIIEKIIHDTIMYEFIYLEIISLSEILSGIFNLFLSKSKGVFFSPVGNVKSNFIANDWRLKKISPGNKKNERNFFYLDFWSNDPKINKGLLQLIGIWYKSSYQKLKGIWDIALTNLWTDQPKLISQLSVKLGTKKQLLWCWEKSWWTPGCYFSVE